MVNDRVQCSTKTGPAKKIIMNVLLSLLLLTIALSFILDHGGTFMAAGSMYGAKLGEFFDKNLK